MVSGLRSDDGGVDWSDHDKLPMIASSINLVVILFRCFFERDAERQT